MIDTILADRYKILERVGGGGMADVYRAHDMLLDRFVAVKILHSQFANDDEFIIKFKREAQGAAKLSHPNIVNIYDVGCDLNTHYIIMEYVSGETLKEKIQREGKLEINEALRIAKEIAKALENAHQNNLIHCDIKPHNILVTERGHIKVTDFGIARAATSNTMTYSGTIIGSVHYFSPEQAKGSAIGTKSDIYSLGVVLYEMVTGCLPFQGESPISIALKHLQEEPRLVSQINASIPVFVEAIIAKAMEKNPENRFTTISVMIADLKAAEKYVSNNKTMIQDEFATQVLPKVDDDTIIIEDRNHEANDKVAPKNSNNNKKLIAILFVILLAGFATGAFLAYGKFWSGNEVTVPDVIGKQVTIAKDLLEKEKLRVKIEETYDDKVPSGQVVSQYPEGGAVVKEQRTVTIYISKGGEAVLVPNLVGISKRDAEVQLKNLGLKLGRVDEEYSNQKAGVIIMQSPKIGTQVTKGYTIDIVVSKGAEKLKSKVPDFRGAILDSVTGNLNSFNLKLGKVTEVEDSKVTAGTIISQSPEPGTEALSGGTIDFTVVKSTAAKNVSIKVTIPDGPTKQAVKIVVTDENGRRVVYESVHKVGETITKSIEGKGTMRVQVYINGNLVQEQNY